MTEALSGALLRHYLFDLLAVAMGVRYYASLRRNAGEGGLLARGNFAVALGAIVGAGLGNKVVFWIDNPHLLPMLAEVPTGWLMGQSMVGGLVGGLIGVEVAKTIAGIKRSTGDGFVFPVLLALMIGRVGCFSAGLMDNTHGVETTLPWGYDYGDGVKRHPAQLYEIAFVGGLWVALARLRQYVASEPGLLFKLMLVAYLLWRLAIDFLKPVPFAYVGGLSGIQVVCLIALALYVPIAAGQARRLSHA